MKTQRMVPVILSGLLIMSLVAVGPAGVQAASSSAKTASQSGSKLDKSALQTTLKKLVSAKIITQTKASAILTKYSSLVPKTTTKTTDVYTNAVKAKILTQVEANAIHNYINKQALTKSTTRAMTASSSTTRSSAGQNQNMAANLKTQLASLVSAGILTQTESDAITAKIDSLIPKKPAQGNTNAQTARADIYSSAVTAGILTQAQADAVHSFLQKQQAANRTQQLTTKLQALVDNGTITSSQKTKILDYLNQKFAEIRAPRSEPQRQGQDTGQGPAKEQGQNVNRFPVQGVLQELVTEGVITSEQASAVVKVIMPSRG